MSEESPMVLAFALVGVILFGLFGRSHRDGGRMIFEFSVSERQKLAYAASKENATTLWLKHGRATVVGAAAFAALVWLISALASPEPSWRRMQSRAVTGFTWISTASPPGYRVWTIDQRGQWHEHYPDGHQAKLFDITKRGKVNGCDGAITKQSATPYPVVFIPDLGCGDMAALFVWGQGPWGPLGSMTTISTLPPAAAGESPGGVRWPDVVSRLHDGVP